MYVDWAWFFGSKSQFILYQVSKSEIGKNPNGTSNQNIEDYLGVEKKYLCLFQRYEGL